MLYFYVPDASGTIFAIFGAKIRIFGEVVKL